MELPTVLIVEDDAIIGRHLQSLLKNLGYQVLGPVLSGEEAIRQVEKQPPSIILMDVSLAGEMDGIDTAQSIQERHDIPIIYITAYADEKTLKRAKITGPFGYLLKPFDERVLHSTVEMALNKHELEKELKESEARFRMLIENQLEGIIITDMKEDIIFANPAAEQIFGCQPGKLLGENFKKFTDDKQFAVIKKQTALRKEGKKSVYELDITLPNQNTKTLSVTATPWMDQSTGVIGAFGVFRDITSIRSIEAAEKEQRLLTEALLDITSAIVSSLNLDEVFTLILNNLSKVVPHDAANIMVVEGDWVRVVKTKGYEKAGLKETVDKISFHLADVPEFEEMARTGNVVVVADSHQWKHWVNLTNSTFIRSCINTPIRVKGRTVGFINVDSHQPNYFSQFHAERLKGFADQAALALENARLYNQMEHLAITDELTGVFNRRGIIEMGQRELNRATRFKHPFSLVWIDFDYFKNVNDTYGHIIGDEVLAEMISLCSKNLRDVDSMGRMGGDEFIILLPETDMDGGLLLAERLRKLIEDHKINTTAGEVEITASFGVTSLTKADTEFAKLLSNADSAMYQAKKAGRNQVSSL